MPDFADLLALRARARLRRHRFLVLCGGPEPRRRDWLAGALAALAPSRPLWLGDAPPTVSLPHCAPRDARHHLGDEHDLIVVDASDGLPPDPFGALAGTLSGGGLLILLTPPLSGWPADAGDRDPSRYTRRLRRVLAADPEVIRVTPDGRLDRLPDARPDAAPAVPAGPWLTADQARAVAAIEQLASGHRHRPLLLTADRGRGKSSALGIAAARLLERRGGECLVTAARPGAAAALFARAAELLPDATAGRNALTTDRGSLRFVAPDLLLRTRPRADLLLVDEAAALPLPLLDGLLRGYPRIAFATTVHGYEGSGRGYVLRFRERVRQIAPGAQALELDQPVRWAADDPLERITLRMLMLDAGPEPAGPTASLRFVPLDRDALADDEARLRAFFGLLVEAHYQTAPEDLRRLLDDPAITVWAALAGERAVAGALIAAEGPLPEALHDAIARGERRPPGGLLPQSLAFHLGIDAALAARCARVLRIAVAPELQRRGIGRRLLAAIGEALRADGVELLGTSFAATPGLVRFWRGAGFSAVRLGIHRDAASGDHSVLMLAPRGATGTGIARAARAAFADELPFQLVEPLAGVEPALVIELLRGLGYPWPPDPRQRAALARFAYGHRPYETLIAPLHALALHALSGADGSGLAPGDAALLVAKVLQRRGWAETSVLAGVAGRRACERRLRAAVAVLLSARAADGH